MKEENEKKYKVLQKKIENLESQITPLISKTRNPETPPPGDHVVPEEINRNIAYIDHLLTAELNQDRGSGQTGRKRLKKMFRDVQLLKKSLDAWAQPQPSSSSVVSSEPPMCPNTDNSDEDYDHKEDDEVINDHDREGMKSFSLKGYSVNLNPLYKEEENSEGVMGSGGVQEDESGEETISRDESKEGSKKLECISDNQIGRHKDEERIKKAKDLKKEKLQKVGGGDTKVNEVKKDYYCYKIAFWMLVFVLGIVYGIRVFSDFADYHSHAVFPTPT